MDAAHIQNELLQAVADILSKEPSELDASAMLFDLGMDSLGLVETFVFIEKQFGLKLLETGIQKENMESIAALSAYIAGMKKG